MLVAVKMPHIEKPAAPSLATFTEGVQALAVKCFGATSAVVSVEEDTDEEMLTPETSEWFQGVTVTPGEAMREYREIHNMTQEALGKKLGGMGRSEISNMERDRRAISKKTAKQLSRIFRVSTDRFI